MITKDDAIFCHTNSRERPEENMGVSKIAHVPNLFKSLYTSNMSKKINDVRPRCSKDANYPPKLIYKFNAICWYSITRHYGPKVYLKTMTWEEQPREEIVKGRAAPSGMKAESHMNKNSTGQMPSTGLLKTGQTHRRLHEWQLGRNLISSLTCLFTNVETDTKE